LQAANVVLPPLRVELKVLPQIPELYLTGHFEAGKREEGKEGKGKENIGVARNARAPQGKKFCWHNL